MTNELHASARELVAKYMYVEPDALLIPGNRRPYDVARARFLTWTLLRKVSGIPEQEIADAYKVHRKCIYYGIGKGVTHKLWPRLQREYAALMNPSQQPHEPESSHATETEDAFRGL